MAVDADPLHLLDVEKRLKIRISAKTNITATLILVLGLVALITGIVFMGVKLSRR